MTLRATAVRRGSTDAPFDAVTLAHDQRRLRRRLLVLEGGSDVMVDLPETVTLREGDALVLDDGRLVGVAEADEKLHSVRGRDARHVSELAWHLGNRHLPAEIRGDMILIARDEIIRTMLIGLGAEVRETEGPFAPMEGAYSGHSHALLDRR